MLPCSLAESCASKRWFCSFPPWFCSCRSDFRSCCWASYPWTEGVSEFITLSTMHPASLYNNNRKLSNIFMYLSIIFENIAAGSFLSFFDWANQAPSFPPPVLFLVPAFPFAFFPRPAVGCSCHVLFPYCEALHAFLIITGLVGRYFGGVVGRTCCSFWIRCILCSSFRELARPGIPFAVFGITFCVRKMERPPQWERSILSSPLFGRDLDSVCNRPILFFSLRVC